MKQLLQALMGGGILCSVLAGCTPGVDADDEDDVGQAQLAQIDPGNEIGRHLQLVFDNDTLLADIVVMHADDGGYSAGTEYWYVNDAALPYLGSKGLKITSAEITGAPPSLHGDEEFTQPVDLTWSRFTADPASGGALYDNGNYHLRLTTKEGSLRRLTWYQVIPSAAKAANILPTGMFKVGSSAVEVPAGHAGYAVDAVLP